MTPTDAAPDGPILVVDDEPVIRETVAELLRFEGYRVETAQDGADALRVMERASPSAVLLDMRMPVLDGWGFVERYRAEPGPHAPIVVCTAATDAARRAAEVAAEGFLAKPFGIDDLLEAVVRFTTPR